MRCYYLRKHLLLHSEGSSFAKHDYNLGLDEWIYFQRCTLSRACRRLLLLVHWIPRHLLHAQEAAEARWTIRQHCVHLPEPCRPPHSPLLLRDHILLEVPGPLRWKRPTILHVWIHNLMQQSLAVASDVFEQSCTLVDQWHLPTMDLVPCKRLLVLPSSPPLCLALLWSKQTLEVFLCPYDSPRT